MKGEGGPRWALDDWEESGMQAGRRMKRYWRPVKSISRFSMVMLTLDSRLQQRGTRESCGNR